MYFKEIMERFDQAFGLYWSGDNKGNVFTYPNVKKLRDNEFSVLRPEGVKKFIYEEISLAITADRKELAREVEWIIEKEKYIGNPVNALIKVLSLLK